MVIAEYRPDFLPLILFDATCSPFFPFIDSRIARLTANASDGAQILASQLLMILAGKKTGP